MESAGERIKGLRTKYGIQQSDLACEGLGQTYISMIEQGKVDLNMRAATKMTNRIKLVAKKNKIKIEEEITPELLIGRKENEIDRLVNNLKSNTEYCYIEINEFLDGCTDEHGEELINRMYEEVFKKSFSKYRDEICTYLEKMFKHIKDTKKMTEIRVKLIRAKLFSDNPSKYKEVINISKVVGNDINKCDDETKASYFNNVAVSYYHLKKYNEASDIINKAKKIKENPFKLRTMTIEANICIKQTKFKRAINIYIQIIKISNDLNETANALSNIADIYNTKNKLELANEYISEAFNFIDEISMYYKYNLYYVKLQIEIKQSLNINTFKNALICARNLDDRIKAQKILDMVIGYFKENALDVNIVVEILKETGVGIEARIFIDSVILPMADETTRKMIESIYYY